MTDDRPAYGTPPEPKYGRRTPHLSGVPGERELTPEQEASLRERSGLEPRRDPFGIVLASILLAFSFGLAALAVQGGWWSLMWVLYGPFALFGGVGMVVSVRKVPRDEKGTPIS